jgi:hypothetical protein
MSDEDMTAVAGLLQRNWEIVQEIIKGLGERTWALRGWAATLWWAVVGYGVTHGSEPLLFALFPFIGVVFAVDCTLKVTQEAFLQRSVELEGYLTAYCVRDLDRLKEAKISTNVAGPTLDEMKGLLRWARVGFWSPYIATALLTSLAISLI